MTTHTRLARARREIEFWRSRKAERTEVVRQAQGQISRLRELIGKPRGTDPPLADISDACLEAMQAETEALRREQARPPFVVRSPLLHQPSFSSHRMRKRVFAPAARRSQSYSINPPPTRPAFN